VDRLASEPGATVEFDQVLLIGDDGEVTAGTPAIPGARVLAYVVDQDRARKVTVFKYKAKSNYRRKTGHRQSITRLRVTEILRS
jgi:large subunit ribosomal protein L21